MANLSLIPSFKPLTFTDSAGDEKMDPNYIDLVDINKNHLVTRFRLLKTQLDETIRQRNEAITQVRSKSASSINLEETIDQLGLIYFQIREMYQQMNMRNNLICTTKLSAMERARFEKMYRFAKSKRLILRSNTDRSITNRVLLFLLIDIRGGYSFERVKKGTSQLYAI